MKRPLIPFVLLGCGVIAILGAAEPAPKARPPQAAKGNYLPTSPDPTMPAVQLFVPGFTVRELPLDLTNQNNVIYAPDGRMFTSGYDGRVHLLRDTDGDGVEDRVTTLWDKTSDDYSLGIAYRGDSLYVLFKSEVARFRDRDGDGIPETRDVAVANWDDPNLNKTMLNLNRRVDHGIGFALGADGSFYVGMGNAAFNNPYRRDKAGVMHYSPENRRGCILKISPDGSKVEQIATGVRYTMSLQWNRAGDLFATDQEGATWLPNGNPFDELLHIQTGRHYGFPPRHPQYLPDVIDEPSVFDYGPQHQSLCGFRFNESGPGQSRFGPVDWEGDAILTGQSRGKLYRTKLVKTPDGYVAQTQLFAAMQALSVDCAFSPRGELVVVAHSGKPDWGSGPQGKGRIFKISYDSAQSPIPVAVYAAGPTETRIVFDRPVPAERGRALTSQVELLGGRQMIAGERYEKMRPGYAVVGAQRTEKPVALGVAGVSWSSDRRMLSVQSAPRTSAVHYAVSLREPASAARRVDGAVVPQDATIELAHTLGGVMAEWTPKGADAKGWSGWLPHPQLAVARELTQGSGEHAALVSAMKRPGTLRLRGQLDLSLMLRPAIQPGSVLAYRYPSEQVTVTFQAKGPLRLSTTGAARVERVDAQTARLVVETTEQSAWVPFDLVCEIAGGEAPDLEVSWRTQEDARPRALALRRVLLPWAVRPAPALESRDIPEIAGGNWRAGRELYLGKGACATCHAREGQGATFGPDLTNTVHRDYPSLRKDIEQPSTTINPDHIGYLIELNDGTTSAGIVSKDTPSALELLDAAGKTTAFEKAQVRSIKPLERSLMPEGLLAAMSEQETKDLMTFLLLPEPAR
ncbi:MAG: heme-binding protein [Verrucomicrobiota bacterium]